MKLIIHIGAGKTGTTSIQSCLERNSSLLKENKTFYSGMYFENVPDGVVDKGNAYNEFIDDYYKDKSKFVEKVKDSLVAINESFGKSDIDNIVWVNESLFDSPHAVMGAINSLEGVVDEINIIFYIRRQDRWLKSAYQQWGIKHKTYAGVVRSFDDWYPTVKDRVDYYSILSEWESYIDKDNIDVVVYENCIDGVVTDFINRIGLDSKVDFDSERSNESLGKYQLSLYKLYNSFFEGGKLPDEVSSFIGRIGLNKINVNDVSADIEYPNVEDLQSLVEGYGNERLEKYSKNGECLQFDDEPIRSDLNGSVNRDSLVSVLLFSLIKMEQRVTILERKLREEGL